MTLGAGLGIVVAIGETPTIAVLRAGEGAPVRTGRFAEVPVGAAVVGRAIDPLGAALDGGPALDDAPRRRLAARPLGVREAAPIAGGIHTGIKAVDLCAPLRQGAVIAACGPDLHDVLSTIVAARGAQIVVASLGPRAAIDGATVVTVPAGAPAALCALVPAAALAIAEEIRANGGDALVVVDDLDRHAAALGELTPAERYSAQAALFARAGRRDPTRGGGSITMIVARASPPSPRPSPLDPLFAMDGAWRFDPPRPGLLAALVTPRGLSKYAPSGTPQALVPHSAALRTTLAHGQQLVADAIGRERPTEASLHVERCQRLLEQPPAPVPLRSLVALSIATWGRALHELAPDDVPVFEAALIDYLTRERPDLLASIDPTKRLSEAQTSDLVEAAHEIVARLDAN